MFYSYQWIKELSETTKSVQEIVDLFTVHSFEIEGVEDAGRGLDHVVVGAVRTVVKHPQADRLRIATVDVGMDAPLTIVCGAPNLAVGQRVPVALVGATLPSGMTITQSTIRGQLSDGMICAEDELGIGTQHDGIVVLPDDAPIGMSFATYTGRDDAVIDIKVLPNRGHDCLSHRGVANELRALEGKPVMTLEGSVPRAVTSWDAAIASDACRRYIAVALEGITTMITPAWMVHRLQRCGIKPINAVVDITNYVMLETGQPLHAFDAARVQKIVVRQAAAGETLTLLDDTQCALTPHDLVITDGKKPIALAGVMGGKESGITDATTAIVLESASFDAPTVRAMQRRHGLPTDAAFRFERDLDPNVAAYAAERATALLTEICGARVVAVQDLYPQPIAPWTIDLTLEAVQKLLGMAIDADTVCDIVTRLGMRVTMAKTKKILHVTVPTVRRDLTTQEDLIEEIGRIYGYDKITPQPLREDITVPATNVMRRTEHALMDVCVADGYDEVKSYAYYAAGDARAMDIPVAMHIPVLNPLTPDYALMRRSLLPGLCRAVKKNLSYFPDVRLCEIGRIYDPTDAVLPDEKLVLGAVVASRDTHGTQFFLLKGLAQQIAAHYGLGALMCDDDFSSAAADMPQLHTTRRAFVRTAAGVTLGWIGEVPRHTQKFYGIKNARVAVMELAIAPIAEHSTHTVQFTPLPKYPTVTRDLSMILPSRMHVTDISAAITQAGGALLQDVTVFDIYHNAATDERAAAYRMTFGAEDRTLTSDDVDTAMADITAALEQIPGVILRTAAQQ